MVEAWLKFFGLTGDPFTTLPLQTGEDFCYLFVKTDDIANHVDPLIDYFETSAPFVRVIEGVRGSGKSTVMHYMIDRLRSRVLTAYIPYQYAALEGYKDPRYGVGADTLFQIAISLARGLANRYKDAASRHRDKLHDVFVGLGADPKTGIIEKAPPPYGVIESRLDVLLDILRSEGIKTLIAVDNYDKLPDQIALAFLKSNYAQGPSEKLNAAGVSVLLSAKTGWIPRMGADTEMGYLGGPIQISRLNPEGAKQLLWKRFFSKAAEGTEFPFTDDGILCITKSVEGVPRFILEMGRTCLIEAAKRNVKPITGSLAQEFIDALGERQERYYEAIEDDPLAFRGFRLLTRLRDAVDVTWYPQLLSGLADIYEGKSLSDELLEVLRDKGIAWARQSLTKPEEREVTIIQEVKRLLDTLRDKRLSVRRFLQWLSKSEVPAILYVTIRKEEIPTDIHEKMQSMASLISREEIRDSVSLADTAYTALQHALASPDYSVAQAIRSMWHCVWHLTAANYMLHMIVDEKKLQWKRPNIEAIKEYLPNIKGAYGELSLDFGIINQYYESAQREVLPEDKSLQDLRNRFQRTVASLVATLATKVHALREEGKKIPRLKIGSLEALGQQLKRDICPDPSDDRYVFLYRTDLSLDKFPLSLFWPFHGQVYCVSFLGKDYLEEKGLSLYELRSNMWVLPTQVNKQIGINNLERFGRGSLLRFRNLFEFAQTLERLGAGGVIALQIHTREDTIVYTISIEDRYYVSVDYLPPQYGISFVPLFDKETVKVRPSPSSSVESARVSKKGLQIPLYPDIQYSNLGAVQKLFASLKGYVHVLDKDFDTKCLKYLNEVNATKVSEIRVLCKSRAKSEELKTTLAAFRAEMANKGITVEAKVLADEDAKEIHDRYILTKYEVYNIPPLNVITQRMGDIKRVEDADMKRWYWDKYWVRAIPL